MKLKQTLYTAKSIVLCLALGNEVNVYFELFPDGLAPYRTAYDAIRAAVRSARPDLPTGITLAFHQAINSDRFELIEAFKDGDFLAYAYYPHSKRFRYDGAADGFGAVLAQEAPPYHTVATSGVLRYNLPTWSTPGAICAGRSIREA